jgi:hypothetical protein
VAALTLELTHCDVRPCTDELETCVCAHGGTDECGGEHGVFALGCGKRRDVPVRGEGGGGGRGDGGVEVKAEERASGASLPAHAIEVEGEGAVKPKSSPRHICPSAVVAAMTVYAGTHNAGRGARTPQRGRRGCGGEGKVRKEGEVSRGVLCAHSELVI